MTRLALAWLFRRPVQGLAVLGTAVGLGSLLTVLAVLNGLVEFDRAAVRGPLSDLLVIPPPSEETAAWGPWQQALESAPGVEAAAPHLETAKGTGGEFVAGEEPVLLLGPTALNPIV